ncbi:MAG: hypothetical protein AUH41_03060 [Gemmatimonadetes bacterium 13_1_40CM_66_11]|nr:MAG: hypothetical protein AUH41_03060 [Gemmatimonadetes bacterium 13_1_40CM_66_11]
MTSPLARFLLGFALMPGMLAAQAGSTVGRADATFESYSFGTGLAFKRISEFTIPIGVTQRVGDRFVIDVSTAFARASVNVSGGGGTITHSGFVDTDLRATISVIPGKLVFNVVGTIPTGATAVPDTTIPLFGATATDLLGFTTPSFGSGGGVSAGFASAFRMGQNWAVGTGASYRYGASYVPVKGGSEMSPGGEMRARFGLEGPFGGGKYFRGALVYTTTAANDLGASRQSTIGDRILGYAAVSMPLGNSHLSLYGWDMRRIRARPGAVPVPRGNVLAVGGRLDHPLGPKATLSPLLEFRHELTGPFQTMEVLGYLLRTGTDLRYRLSDRATGVIQAQLAFGTLHDGGRSVSIVGPRLGALIEWTR